MDAITSPEGKAVVERLRCIGCALCITTCPSGALRLEPNEKPRIPPDDTKALHIQMLQDRYGPWGMAKIGMRKALGLKI
jgi:Fe-S-cluster-containing hydrogenase component 2